MPNTQPSSPDSPVSADSPDSPVSPESPESPGSPLTPGSPLGPGSPTSDESELLRRLDLLTARLDDLETRGGVFHDVRHHGAVGDGLTDDTAAIEAASMAAGNHGIVFFGRGRFLVTRTIKLPPGQQWQGLGIAETTMKDDPAPHVIATRVPDGYAIDATYNTVFRHLRIEGEGSGKGMIARGAVRFDEVSLQRFDVALTCDNLWYGHFQGLRLYRNRTGIRVERAYNLTLLTPRINCVDDQGNASVGLDLADNVDVKIFGGAIEAYKVGIQAANHDSIHLHSVYFESNPPHPEVGPGLGAIGVQLSNTRSSTVTAVGCYVYLNHQRAWIDADGPDTTASIVAMGTTFKGGNPPEQGLRTLAYRWAQGSPVRATLTGDQWTQVEHKDSADYLPLGVSRPAEGLVEPPPGIRPGRFGAVVRRLASRLRFSR